MGEGESRRGDLQRIVICRIWSLYSSNFKDIEFERFGNQMGEVYVRIGRSMVR